MPNFPLILGVLSRRKSKNRKYVKIINMEGLQAIKVI
jgi:hypothetical protein